MINPTDRKDLELISDLPTNMILTFLDEVKTALSPTKPVYGNSSLVVYKKLSPNCSKPRNHKIDTISIHCVAGNLTVEALGNVFAPESRGASSNYGIGTDGRIAMYVEEANRSWCTSSAANDNRAITIEVSNDSGAPDWHVSDKAKESLIQLLVDICKRNGIPKLLWKADKNLIGQVDKQNMTVHRWLAPKSCLPIDRTELLTHNGWKKLADIEIGDEVACAHIDDLSIKFGPVLDIVPIKEQEVYSVRDVEATADHRMIYYNNHGKQHVGSFSNLFNGKWVGYIPNAGFYDGEGLPLTDNEICLLVAMQADGHYMYENREYSKDEKTRIKTKNKKYYGIEFHLKKERKINRILSILDSLKYKFNINNKKDGSVSIRSYDKNLLKFCQSNLDDKMFTWKLLELDPKQAKVFLNELPFWDGSIENNSYFSTDHKNRDIVSAVASINGVGSLINEYYDLSLKKQMRSLGDGVTKRLHRKKVSCVTVDTGFILIRQNRRTTIVGNCPGPYLYDLHGKIADEVNKRLGVNGSTYVPETPSSSGSNDKIIWDFFKSKGLYADAIAGIMGNIYAESALISVNLQNVFEKTLGYTDASYTKAVDDGTYNNFVYDKAGYGICQWTYWSRKEALFKFAKDSHVSIGDLQMQLNFLWTEFQAYPSMMETFKNTKSIREASDAMLLKFERPLDQSEAVKVKRAEYGKKYYDKFANTGSGIKQVTAPTQPTAFKPYTTKVTASSLNCRKGPGINYPTVLVIKDKGTYTIIEESTGSGAKLWGKLKSGIGWISLDYTQKN